MSHTLEDSDRFALQPTIATKTDSLTNAIGKGRSRSGGFFEEDNVLSNPRVHSAILFVMVPLIILFFKPTFLEFLGFYLIDIAAFFIYRAIDLKLFFRIYPKSRIFFPHLREEIATLRTFDERNAIYDEIAAFPGRRTRYLVFASCIKVTPAFLYILWMWGEPGTYLLTIAKGMSICAFTFSFASGMSYLAYHNVVSKTLHSIHERFNWSEVFKRAAVVDNGKDWAKAELLCSSVLIFFFLGLVAIIIADRNESLVLSLSRFGYVSASVIYFIVKILSTSRSQLILGISDIVERYSDSKSAVPTQGLSLSTNPQLAYHQKAINTLVERVIAGERELEYWVHKLAEDSRFRDLGELTGLLVHDSMTPLSIIRYSLARLVSTTGEQLAGNENVDRIKVALERLVELIDNVRRSIREESNSFGSSSPQKAFHDMKMLTGMRFSKTLSFQEIEFISDIPDNVPIAISQPFLNQIFLNLFSNAANNLLSHKVENPRIEVQLLANDDQLLSLHFRDNGTGLSAKDFKNITEDSARDSNVVGVGLRLIWKLLRQHGCSIEVLDREVGIAGTHFVLKLKKHHAPMGGDAALVTV